VEAGGKLYFASDLHLGFPDWASSLERERMFVDWLEMARRDASAIFLLGDMFEFWHEWKRVVPRGHVRFLGKIGELTDAGLPVYYFTGNHDLWVDDYLPRETGATLVRDRMVWEQGGKRFFLHHGDGLGPGDLNYKRLKRLFRNRALRWLLARLHPNFTVGLALRWSGSSREADKDRSFKGQEGEWLLRYARRKLESEHYDFFVFGHRHIPYRVELGQGSVCLNLGDWLEHFTYGVYDGQELRLERWRQRQVAPAAS